MYTNSLKTILHILSPFDVFVNMSIVKPIKKFAQKRS